VQAFGQVSFAGAVLTLSGTLSDNGEVFGNTLINSGVISVVGGTLSSTELEGTGTINLGVGASIFILGGASQTIQFAAANGALTLGDASPAPGEVTGFQPGDTLVLTETTFTSATYDATAHTLALSDNGSPVDVINDFTATAGSLSVNDGTIIYASAPNPTSQSIAAVADAVGANTVVSTMTLPHSATPITGAGVKVGIISDSFNVGGSANAATADGYIPNSDGVSTVQVLSDGTDNVDDGLVMAEDIHAVAPGASIAFASLENNNQDPATTFAQDVEALQAAGCNVIVDDSV
jgi:hypothetical protein